MALYTSYYTRQLALRGDGGAGLEMQQEGEKAVQKSVPRRTVDYGGPYVTWFEVRPLWQQCAALRSSAASVGEASGACMPAGRQPQGPPNRCREAALPLPSTLHRSGAT